MPTDHPMEGEDAIENDLESDCHQTVSKNSSSDSSRVATETAELETEVPVVDKSAKVSYQRSSNRLTKRARKEQTSDVVLKKAAAVVVKQESTPLIRSKTRRPWELWSVEDKNAFFEALCEYGKDFESIQSYIAQRSKKKGVATNMIKNKDQVRHFYYRTWHKISKFLEISECVQKQTQELYGLINYAELRKKIGGCLNEKNRLKLNELVFSGVTTVKHKGKKLRIKTPVCRALKKLNNFSDTKEPDADRLPKEIIVEFRPFTNAAWLQVQNLAQNPRVRTKVCLQKRLRHVIEFLQRRWTPYRLKRKEQILNSLPNYNPEELTCDTPPVLRVKPPRDVKIYPLTLSTIDTASSSDVCLEKYMKLSHKSLCKDVNKSKKVVNSKPKPLGEKIIESCELAVEKAENVTDNTGEHCDMNSVIDMPDLCPRGSKSADDNSYINLLTPPKSVPELEQPVEPNFNEVPRSLSSFTSLLDSSAKLSFHSDNLDVISEDMDYNTLLSANNCKPSDLFNGADHRNQINSDMNFDTNLSDCNFEDISVLNNCASFNAKKDSSSSEATEKDKHSNEKSEAQKSNKNASSDEGDSIYVKTVKQGWTVEEAGFLTFGELYLLLGKPPTIILEYEFEYPESNTTSTGGAAATTTNPVTSELSRLLTKVFEVAQSYFADPKQKQLPGKQGRGSSSKSTKLKSSGLNDKASKDFPSSQTNPNPSPSLPCKDVNIDIVVKPITSATPSDHSQSSSLPLTTATTSSSTSSSDKHVFVMPVGTAPRTIKHPNQTSLKEEIGKLLPCTRRGCRVRRKPLVVQRPLLPREGMRPLTGPRPMTVVHLVPSVSPLTTVIPSGCARQKSTIPAPKKVVKILPPAVDMHPVQVPVIKQLHPDSGQSVILQNSLSSPHVIVNSSTAESLQIINNPMLGMSSTCETALNRQSGPSQDLSSISQMELNTSTDLNTLNLNLLSGHSKGLNESKDPYASLSQLSLSDASNLVSSVSPTFLDEFGLTSKNSIYDPSNLSSCLNVDIGSSKDCTSLDSSAQQSYKINSAEIQWLNGESTELSLNTFLNSIESPSKMSSATVTENSNLDPMVRLAPVVDSQVRCLLDECSIDFITKFEDLADVINNSSSSDSKQT